MEAHDLVTFLSDFGWGGGYVAACEATVVTINPRARVLHVSHDVAAGDIRDGALILARTLVFAPPGVHMGVVDPGVGTDRRLVALQTGRGDYLVGPDNGLLLPAAEALDRVVGAWSLDAPAVRRRAGLSPEAISATFHGRDIFAPAAALLSAQVPPADLGEPVPTATLTRAVPFRIERLPDGLRAEVIEVDRFGNIALALAFDSLPGPGQHLGVEIEGEDQPAWHARTVDAFGELAPGELGLFRDSWGQAALALNGASAAQLLGVRHGIMIRLRSDT